MTIVSAPNPLGPGTLRILLNDEEEPQLGVWETEDGCKRLSEDTMWAAVEVCNVVDLFPDFNRLAATWQLAGEEV